MKSIPLPSIFKFEETDNPLKKRMVLEPCFSGYGITIGNVLRRVLMSSLEGGAVTAIKISGVDHEFSTIENVKEDVVDIILNFKKLRLKVFDDEEVRLSLKVKGAKEVTAKDIKKDSKVEIANLDLKLFTIADPKTEVEVEIFVKKGRGYEPTEARNLDEVEVGVISIDSLFSPIKNVGYEVENVRVGQMTNFEKLILDIETDGTIKPEEAVYQSAQIIMDHMKLVSKDYIDEQERVVAEKKIAEEEAKSKAEASEAETEDSAE